MAMDLQQINHMRPNPPCIVNATSRCFLYSLYVLCFVGSVSWIAHVDAVGYWLTALKLSRAEIYPWGGMTSAPVKKERTIPSDTLQVWLSSSMAACKYAKRCHYRVILRVHINSAAKFQYLVHLCHSNGHLCRADIHCWLHSLHEESEFSHYNNSTIWCLQCLTT